MCCDRDDVAAAIDSRLRLFRAPAPPAPSVRFEIVDAPAGHRVERPAGRGRPVYDPPAGDVLYFEDRDELYIGYEGRIRVLCEFGSGLVRTSVTERAESDGWLLSHPLFTIPLVELLKRRGLYSVHAAAAADSQGRLLLLPGGTGSGKSTLALALLRAGCRLLGDDLVFLTGPPHAVRVLAFPDEIDATDATLAMFPELDALRLEQPRPGWPKRQLWPEVIYGSPPVLEALPAVVVFPHVADIDRSTLDPMDRNQALLSIVPNVLLTRPDASQAHLDRLAGLVSASDCYRLAAGHDINEIAGLLVSLLGRPTAEASSTCG